MSEAKSENWVLAFLCLLGAIASENPQAKAWGYTDEARLRGLIQKADPLDLESAPMVLGSGKQGSPLLGKGVTDKDFSSLLIMREGPGEIIDAIAL